MLTDIENKYCSNLNIPSEHTIRGIQKWTQKMAENNRINYAHHSQTFCDNRFVQVALMFTRNHSTIEENWKMIFQIKTGVHIRDRNKPTTTDNFNVALRVKTSWIPFYIRLVWWIVSVVVQQPLTIYCTCARMFPFLSRLILVRLYYKKDRNNIINICHIIIKSYDNYTYRLYGVYINDDNITDTETLLWPYAQCNSNINNTNCTHINSPQIGFNENSVYIFPTLLTAGASNWFQIKLCLFLK